MPPPIRTLTDPQDSNSHQDRMLKVLVAALRKAGRSLKAIVVEPTASHLLQGIVNPTIGFPAILLSFEPQAWTPMLPLPNLSRLRLDLSQDHHTNSNMRKIYSSYQGGRLARFLAPLTNLEDVYIRVQSALLADGDKRRNILTLHHVFGSTTFSKLRVLHLDSFWLEPSHLISFLLKHKSSLEEVTLSSVHLGGLRNRAHPILLPIFHGSGLMLGSVRRHCPKNGRTWQRPVKSCQGYKAWPLSVLSLQWTGRRWIRRRLQHW